ncbi:DUF2550 family protein [Actinomyces dentalis]|jgi:hypothetical protein|uniref:DUF2550 family protein n=1 Tax=Actinomyces dentalis TaxID=272548 RepID=UPI0023575AFA|nr:DUF2550 family protein [Actinomyces dentalis]
MGAMGWCVPAVLAGSLVLVVVFLGRLRFLASQVGSFECALLRSGRRRYMSGIATFGDEAIEWHRLISLSPRARYRMHRDDLVLGGPRPRAGGRIVDVTCTVAGKSFDLAMLSDSHSALVAWLESAAPTQPSLL